MKNCSHFEVLAQFILIYRMVELFQEHVFRLHNKQYHFYHFPKMASECSQLGKLDYFGNLAPKLRVEMCVLGTINMQLVYARK
jgi:hypothetical protein